MAYDKKNIPEAAPPAEAPAPAVGNAVVPEQPAPEPALTNAETVMLEHEGQAALFEMGEAVPNPADAVTHAEVEEPATPEVPKTENPYLILSHVKDPKITYMDLSTYEILNTVDNPYLINRFEKFSLITDQLASVNTHVNVPFNTKITRMTDSTVKTLVKKSKSKRLLFFLFIATTNFIAFG